MITYVVSGFQVKYQDGMEHVCSKDPEEGFLFQISTPSNFMIDCTEYDVKDPEEVLEMQDRQKGIFIYCTGVQAFLFNTLRTPGKLCAPFEHKLPKVNKEDVVKKVTGIRGEHQMWVVNILPEPKKTDP